MGQNIADALDSREPPWGYVETPVTALQKRKRRKLLFPSFLANKLEQ